MNLIFTALLLFLILFWSCESDIHSFAVVFDFCFYHMSLIFITLLLFLISIWSVSLIFLALLFFNFILVM